MQIIFDALILAVGFVLLVQSAKFFVDSSVEIAKTLKIPTVIVGLTIVAMGTSAPEAAISVSAALRGQSDLAIANSVGSNLFNQLFIVGLSAMLFPITVKLSKLKRDYIMCVVGTLLILLFVIIWPGSIPRLGGIILLTVFTAYMIVLVKKTMADKSKEEISSPEQPEQTEASPPKPLWRSLLICLVCIIVIILAGQLTVSSAGSLAAAFGVSERVIGLTIVSIGTSLPELVTTIIACKKKEGEFALGFIIGSSTFNLLFVLGLAGTITPLTVAYGVLFDIIVLAMGTFVFLSFARTSKKIKRVEGIILFVMYLVYITWVLFN